MADFGLESLKVEPSSTQAGGHPNVTVSAGLRDPDADLKDVVVKLPPGLIGNPNAPAATCTQQQFADYECPAASKVGTASSDASTWVIFPLNVTASGDVFLVAPQGDEPARLGLALEAVFGIKMPLQAPITVDSADASLITTIKDVPQKAGGLDITVKALSLTLNGTAPNGKPFMTLPTACTPAETTMTVTAHDGATGSARSSFTPTGCDAVPFAPGAGVAMASPVARTPTGATVRLTVPEADAPVRQSYVRGAKVVLPEGVALNAPLGGGLETCADAVAPACPAASDIGDASVDTPLVGTLAGDVFLGEPREGDPYRLVVVLQRPGVRLVLRGSVALDPATGRITTTFADLPMVPFTTFALTFRGGDQAVLRQTDRCGTQEVAAELTPWSGGAARTATATYETTDCADTLTPAVSVTPSTTQGGASPALTIAIERPDRQPTMRELTLALPSGLLGRLGSVRPGDRLGSVEVTAGAGGAPLTLGGDITFAAGAAPGELGALVVRVPAKVGPFDLGTVTLRSSLRLGEDGRLHVAASGLPEILGGIPLEIRRMVLRLDREGFLLNPTACGTPFVAASVNGAAVSAPYPVTGCERLAFGPRLAAQVSGGRAAVRRGGRPTLTTTITQPEGQASMRTAAVTLPSTFAANLGALGAVCDAADPATCPQTAVVGSAEARTPLLAEPLSGPVVLVKGKAGQTLPGLAVLLRGAIPLRLDADITLDKKQRIIATFGGLPDVPVTRFALTLNGGPAGMTTAGADMCGVAGNFTAAFTSWAGGKAEGGARAAVEGCGNAPKVKVTLGRVAGTKGPQLVVKVTRAPGGAALRGVDVTLPATLRGRAKPLVRADGKGRSTRSGATVTATVVKASRKATKSLELRLPAGALAPTKALRTALAKGKMPTVELTVDVRTADRDTWTTKYAAKVRKAKAAKQRR